MAERRKRQDSDFEGSNRLPEFDLKDGLALALAYLEDPSSVPCPHCGPDTIEIVGFLDAASMDAGAAVPKTPENDYTVILYCHGCGRAAALDMSRRERDSGPKH